MTNIFVEGPNGADDKEKRQEGMIKAGFEVNAWISNPSQPAAEYFFDDVFSDVTANGNFQFFIEVEGHGHRLHPTKKDNVYRFGGKKRLRVRCEDDGQDKGNRKKMTIGVPEERKDLLTGGYVDTILDDLLNIAYDGAPAPPPKKTEAKQYLLASIFLNRCH